MPHRLPPNVWPPLYLNCRAWFAQSAAAVAAALLLASSTLAAEADDAASAVPTAASAPVTVAPPVARKDAAVGQRLYETVGAYSGLGNHRSGTNVDAATLAWFSLELQRRGGQVERAPFRFDRYEATSDVTIDGREVPSMPLYYQGLGDVKDDHPYVAAVPVLDNDRATPALLDVIDKARAAGARSVVVATMNPLGELQTPNRVPVAGDGLPVVFVPGRWADALRAGAVHVQFSGKIVGGQSANIIATFGEVASASRPPIVINTPLTGWFAAAAERGTGIAIALALAERIGAHYPVLVVGSPGHELLPHIGLATFLQQNRIQPALIVHLGANVALGRIDTAGNWSLIDTRAVGVRMDPAAFARMEPALQGLGVKPRLNPPKWYGEGALWADALNAPLISFVGIGPQFHTPADVPQNTTSPALMRQSFEAIAGAVEAWLAGP